MALVGNVYIQDTDPGAVGFGYDWRAPTSGAIKTRNTTNTAWVNVGNANSVGYGMLSREGGVMTGPITGVTGWAPENNPDFNTSAKRDGIDLATVNDLSDLQTTLTAQINSLISSGFANLSTSSSVSTMIAWSSGTIADGGTLPLPSFTDRQATLDEVVVKMVSTAGPTTSGSGTISWQCTVDNSLLVTSKVVIQSVTYSALANYVIICVKKQ